MTGKRRDPADWTAYGRPRGRPKIGGEEVHATIPAADLAVIDAIAAARGCKRTDVIREAVAEYARRHAGSTT
jgi:hypothetical protein